MQPLYQRLATLRFELRDTGKARRHRYQVFDRERAKVLAKFDEVIYAENSLRQIQEAFVRELIDEHSNSSLSHVAA